MKFAALLAGCAVMGLGQGTPPVSLPQPLPQNWVGAGGGYSPTGSPRGTAWVSYAHLLSAPNQFYSFSSHDYVFRRGQLPMVSTRTGGAKVLLRFRELYFIGLATAGVAETATATTGALSGGGLLMYRFRGGGTIEAVVRQIKAGGVNSAVYEIGSAWSW